VRQIGKGGDRMTLHGRATVASLVAAFVMVLSAGSAQAAPPVPVGAGVVGGLVWFDANGDGVVGPTEAEIGAVGVTLTVAGADGVLATVDDVTVSAATAADGRYEFVDVVAGPYRVNVVRSTLPVDVVGSFESDGTLDDTVTKTLAAGEVDRTVGFGYTRRADLQIVNRVAPGPYAPPTTVAFELTVTNAGPSSADAVLVNDTLPGRMVLVAEGSDPRCTSTDGTSIVCRLGTLPAGAFDTVTISAAVDAVTDQSGFTNLAAVGSPTPDPIQANNSATATIEVVASQAPPPTDSPTRTLPKTGTRGALIGLSWAVLVAGAVLCLAARRRRLL
jgi:uncharacterized repeat protein (TIGR01451 family)